MTSLMIGSNMTNSPRVIILKIDMRSSTQTYCSGCCSFNMSTNKIQTQIVLGFVHEKRSCICGNCGIEFVQGLDILYNGISSMGPEKFKW